MNRNSTPSNTEFASLVRMAILRQTSSSAPKESVVQFIKRFARNYRANDKLPEGLQGYMLS